jgi:raffinose/stachyose/melibiose transport system permease protein
MPDVGSATRHRVWVTFLVTPPLAVMAVFVVYPILSAFSYAFFAWHGLSREAFVGLENFVDLFTKPHYAQPIMRAFGHNLIVLAALLMVQNGGGFLLAWFLHREPFGFRFHRVAVFLPVILSSVIVAFLWKLLLHPNFGVVNGALNAAGLGNLALPWLGDSRTALAALIFANAWHWIGFPTLVFLAGMQRIPREVLESAELDGASQIQVLRRIVWPLAAPSATVTFTLLFIGAFNWFELPYLMTGLEGSPFGSTDVLGLVFYRLAFGNQSASVQDFGHGSALATLLFLFMAAVATAATIRLRRREIAL